MFEGSVSQGPDRLSVLMALGSYSDPQPIAPEFTICLDEPERSSFAKVMLRVCSLENGSGSGLYVLKGSVAENSRPPRPGHFSFAMLYDANTRTGYAHFYLLNEQLLDPLEHPAQP